jgi:hypothetical protein
MTMVRLSGASARHWLDDVFGLFPADGLSPAKVRIVAAAAVPEPYRRLLVHEHHMTVALERHYGVPVDLEVLEVQQRGDSYARRLFLRTGWRSGPRQAPVVMAGVMRVLLGYCGEPVRRAILDARVPLGRILIEHRVLRRVENVAFLRVGLTPSLAAAFRCPRVGVFTYGRLALIFCGDEPAVELLEILAPVQKNLQQGRHVVDRSQSPQK